MEALLDRAMKVAEAAEVFSVMSRSTEVHFEANRLKRVQTKESTGNALRIIKNGRVGFAASTKIGGEADLVAMALEIAPFGAEARFEFPGKMHYGSVPVFDPAVESLSEETLVDLGQSLIDRIRTVEPGLVCEASVSRGLSEIRIRNSAGGDGHYRKSTLAISIEGVLVRGTDMLFVGDLDSSCRPIGSVDSLAGSVIQQLERGREIAAPPSGRVPVIFTPHGLASALLSPLVVAFNGKTVLRGASPLGHRRGEAVFAREFSLWDDGTIPFCPAAAICDDEGVPTQRTSLVGNGVVEGFLYDLQTAAEAGTRSTGNANRALGSLPTPQMTALIIGEGRTSFDDMLSGIPNGLVVEQVMGATQGNILGGDFSGNVLLGYRVEHGRIVGRVKDTMISGNVYEVLKDGIVLGADSRWLGGSLRTPSIFCPAVAVAAKG